MLPIVMYRVSLQMRAHGMFKKIHLVKTSHILLTGELLPLQCFYYVPPPSHRVLQYYYLGAFMASGVVTRCIFSLIMEFVYYGIQAVYSTSSFPWPYSWSKNDYSPLYFISFFNKK
jgi:hypothetical protein